MRAVLAFLLATLCGTLCACDSILDIRDGELVEETTGGGGTAAAGGGVGTAGNNAGGAGTGGAGGASMSALACPDMSTEIFRDDFERSVSSGWDNSWLINVSVPGRYRVGGGVGFIDAMLTESNEVHRAPSLSDVEVLATVRWDEPTGLYGSVFASVVARIGGAFDTSFVEARVGQERGDGVVLEIVEVDSFSEDSAGSAPIGTGLRAAGYHIRFRVSGAGDVFAVAWPVGSIEPDEWMVEVPGINDVLVSGLNGARVSTDAAVSPVTFEFDEYVLCELRLR